VKITKGSKDSRSTFPERILLHFSRDPSSSDCEAARETCNPNSALLKLCAAFPNFMTSFAGKDVLDFGCGLGYQVVALAKNNAKHVVGIESNARRLNEARNLALQAGVTDRVEFAANLEDRFRSRFDLVISQNSMEHYPDPLATLREMKTALKRQGTLLITFGPPWYAPEGSHMHFFTTLPWVNILFNERTVMRVRAHFRNDGATRYEDVESGLNKMTVAKFERIVTACGMKVRGKKYDCVKRLNALGKIPILRELFINNISCQLQPN
jgi:SAM-dependent methyltransferase